MEVGELSDLSRVTDRAAVFPCYGWRCICGFRQHVEFPGSELGGIHGTDDHRFVKCVCGSLMMWEDSHWHLRG